MTNSEIEEILKGEGKIKRIEAQKNFVWTYKHKVRKHNLKKAFQLEVK